MPSPNPLLHHHALPQFDQITPDHAEPAIRHILTEAEQALLSLEG